jgi:DNA-binding CsgD family transcriptional regulator
MQQIDNLFALTPAEIDYKISMLRESHKEILLHLAHGKTYQEIADLLGITRAALQMRIYSACDRVGVANRSLLLALFVVWKYATNNTEYQSIEQKKDTQYGVVEHEKRGANMPE